MTMNPKRRRAHDKLAALPGVRPVRRPVLAGQSRGVRPLLRADRTEVGASAGGHPRRSRCRVDRPLPGVSATRHGTESRRDHGRASRRRDVPPRRQRLRPAARGADHRSGRRRCRRRPRRRPGGQGSHLRHLVRHVPRGRCRCAAPGPGARDGARFTRCCRPPTSTTCAIRRVACCGTATTPRPPLSRPRCASSSTARCSVPRPPSWPQRSTASLGPRLLARQLDLLLAGRPGCGRVSGGRPDFCSSARRRTATSPTWSARSATANSTLGRCPTVNRSTLPLPTTRSPLVQRISKPNPTTSSQRCPSSAGRRWSSPAAAT